MNPGVPNVVSEYGSVVADRPGEYFFGYGFSSPFEDDPQKHLILRILAH
jgi:hypothetical protein